MILTWNNSIGFIQRDTFNSPMNAKPALGFTYDALYFEPATSNAFRVEAGANIQLDAAQITTVENYITVYDFSYLTKHYVDINGKYVGYGLDNGVTEVPSAPPLDANYYWNGTAYVYVHAVDVSGNYLGNVEIDANTILVASSPSTQHEIWDGAKWTDGRDISAVIEEGKVLIDQAAGKARAKYITDVSGQAETYTEKAKQADAYIAATLPNINDYPLVKAEFNAMFAGDNTVTEADAANYIAVTRDNWLLLAAPIEELRRTGKTLLALEINSDSAVSLINTTIANLMAV